ncbi:MAG TPA: hypothetical protein DDW52_16530 [Planctomycetaceae bacterium]|nr:hypothetical protein [Planctomycetaceae bacterium]
MLAEFRTANFRTILTNSIVQFSRLRHMTSPTSKAHSQAPSPRRKVAVGTELLEEHGRFFLNLVCLIAFSLSLYLSFTSGTKLAPEWLQIAVGAIGVPVASLCVTGFGYVVLRHSYFHLVRKKVEQHEKAKLQLPSNVMEVSGFDEIGLIHRAQHDLLPHITGQQGRFRAMALTTQIAASLAVLIVVLQQIVWPGSYFGDGLLLGKAVLLCYVLFQIILNKQPTAAWVLNRTKAEILRRDQYLALGHSGPFAESDKPSVKERVRRIATASAKTIESELSVELERPWKWLNKTTSPLPTSPVFPDLLDRVRCFRHRRIGKQIAWMNSAALDVDRTSKILFAVACLLAFLACGSSFFAFVRLAAEISNVKFATPAAHVMDAFRIIGLFLPALMGAVLAIRSVFNLGSLSRQYKFTANQLFIIEHSLAELQSELENSPADKNELVKLEHQFRVLVMRGEQTLLDELIRWRIIVDRDGFDI